MSKAAFGKIALMSLRLVAVVAIIGIIYGSITMGVFNYRFAFIANFWVGSVIFIGGLLVFITPTFLLMKKSRLIDHTTYAQKFMEERERKRLKAIELISTGLCSILIAGFAQLIVWFLF